MDRTDWLVLISICAVIVLAAFFVLREIVSTLHPDDSIRCERAVAAVAAMNACLSNRPQCVINGPDEFRRYHEAKDLIAAKCGINLSEKETKL